MPRVTRGALIQAKLSEPGDAPVEVIKRSMIEKHVQLIADAADQGAQVCCLQELFYGPYFCAEQNIKWYSMVERVPDGPTIQLMMNGKLSTYKIIHTVSKVVAEQALISFLKTRTFDDSLDWIDD